MTCVSNSFMDYNSVDVEKFYTVEVVDFDGGVYCVQVMAYNAEDAQCMAADMVENADYTCVLFAEII